MRYAIDLIRWALIALGAPLRALKHRRTFGKGAFVELTVDGTLVREPVRRPLAQRLLRRAAGRTDREPVPLQRLMRRLQLLEEDPRVAGLVVRLESIDAGWARLSELRSGLEAFTARGRPVVVFVPKMVDNRGAYVASAAEHLWLAPPATFAATGAAARGLFWSEALKRVGVRIEVASAGRYKSAPDALTRTERSAADLEQTRAIIDAIDETLTRALSRGDDDASVQDRLDQAPLVGSYAVEAGLATGVCRDEAIPETLAASLSLDTPPKVVEVRRHAALVPARRQLFPPSRRIAVIEVHGAIIDGGSPLGGVDDEQIVAALRAAGDDRRIAAVVLSVDSRGGSVTASDRIFGAVRRLAADKPVVACLEDVAASGGYYVACGAERIVASPLTLTGSIGVFAVIPTWPDLAASWNIGRDVVRNRRFAGAIDPWSGFDEELREKAQADVRGLYDLFIDVVAEARGRPREAVHAVAQGRVWTGRAAREAGLVDGLGGFGEAVAWARERAEARTAEELVYVRKSKPKPRPDPVAAAVDEAARAFGFRSDLAREALALAAVQPRAVAWVPVTPSTRER